MKHLTILSIALSLLSFGYGIQYVGDRTEVWDQGKRLDFNWCLREQLKLHPSMQPQDLVKLCFQGAFGAEHAIPDENRAKQFLEDEFKQVEPAQTPLFEIISPDVCRVNIAEWKRQGIPSTWLLRLFIASTKVVPDGKQVFENLIATATEMVRQNQAPFTLKAWEDYLAEYRKGGIKAVHHSQGYRDAEKPAYRIVSTRFIPLFKILEKAATLNDGSVRVVAFDGRCASGKTTLAKMLQNILDAELIQMDDFFLPPDVRTPERQAEPGGNVHYERFEAEVLKYIKQPVPFEYRIFDCKIQDYKGKREIGTKPWRIVEGAYSFHPRFGDYADIRVFSDINPREQMRRILNRNGEQQAQVYRTRWIPMEEKYIRTCNVLQRSHIVIGDELE